MKKPSNRIIILQKDLENVKQPTVLGFDISSATVGWGLISVPNPMSLIAYGHIKPMDSKNLEIDRLYDIYKQVSSLCDILKPSIVAVEDIFLFMKGKSTARTITLLTAFNRVVSLAAYQKIGDIKFYSVHDIRKIIKSVFKSNLDLDKEDIPNFIRNNLEIKFENIINKKGNIAKETYDEADGIAVSWCCSLCQSDIKLAKLIEKKPIKKKGRK